jgi:hypothetical protein
VRDLSQAKTYFASEMASSIQNDTGIVDIMFQSRSVRYVWKTL